MAAGRVGTAKAMAIAAPIIMAILLSLFGVSYLVSSLLGLPPSLSLPAVVRLLGGATAILGLSMAAWTFRARSPASMIVSTYVTFDKAIRRIPAADSAGRTEPLVVSGPQKYTRNPLYFGAIAMVLGWALLGGYTFVLVATLALLLWFGLVLIPLEERELRALFGEEWKRYSAETPMLFPFIRRKKPSGAS